MPGEGETPLPTPPSPGETEAAGMEEPPQPNLPVRMVEPIPLVEEGRDSPPAARREAQVTPTKAPNPLPYREEREPVAGLSPWNPEQLHQRVERVRLSLGGISRDSRQRAEITQGSTVLQARSNLNSLQERTPEGSDPRRGVGGDQRDGSPDPTKGPKGQ